MKGQKVILRALEPGDIELLYRWENNPETWEVSGTNTPFSKHVLEQYLMFSHQDIYTNKQLRLVIERNEDQQAVGLIDLFDFDPANQRAGIGILIGDPAFRKNGFASEALDLLVDYSFNKLGLHQLYASVGEINTDSLNLFRKKGFTESGLRKEWVLSNGKWITEIFLQLINR